MEIEIILNKKKELHSHILNFIENEDNDEDCNLKSLTNYINESNICKNEQDLKDLLYIILNISNNHRRIPDFFDKIIQILRTFLRDIQSFFSDCAIYDIFKSNKLLILLLFENKIIIPSPKLINIIISEKELNQLVYSLYFFIKPYIDKNAQEQIETEISI